MCSFYVQQVGYNASRAQVNSVAVAAALASRSPSKLRLVRDAPEHRSVTFWTRRDVADLVKVYRLSALDAFQGAYSSDLSGIPFAKELGVFSPLVEFQFGLIYHGGKQV